MTSRVPMVSAERARELGEAMGMPARRTQSEAFRVLANNPGVARVAYSQLIQLLENNKLDTRLRELMIMRIGWVTGSAYEWTQHWRVATTAGIPPEDILAVRDWRNSERLTAGGQGDPRRHRRVPRRQIHLGRSLGRGGKTRHRPGAAGRIHHRDGQLDDVFPAVQKPAHSARGRCRGLAAGRARVAGGAGNGVGVSLLRRRWRAGAGGRSRCGRCGRQPLSARRRPARRARRSGGPCARNWR